MSADSFDSLTFRRVLGHFASGITIVTSKDGDSPVGFTCQSFASVSLDPPLIAFFAHTDSTSWAAIRERQTFAVNILAHKQENISRIFGLPGAEKFKGMSTRLSPNGSPLLDGVIAWLDCRVEHIFEAGDHEGVIGRVETLAHADNVAPLLYFRGGYGTFQS